jgi:hypothetical protein
MFPAVDDELSKNPFFKGWKEKAVFAKLLSPPPLLIARAKFGKMLKINSQSKIKYWFFSE